MFESEFDKVLFVRQMSGTSPEDVNWTDDIIRVYLAVAERKIINRAYPYSEQNEMPKKYDILQCEIALYLLNKRGAEGETSHSENGVTRNYEDADIPNSLIGQVVPSCGVI